MSAMAKISKEKKRIAGYTLSFILLAVVAVWVSSRWKVWFDNPSEDEYVTSAVPSRILLTFGDSDGMTSRNISWICDSVVTSAFVELVDLCNSDSVTYPADGEVFESRGGKSAFYVCRLRHLAAGHSYKYRVNSNNTYSQWYQFETQNEDDKNVSFLYVGDVQDTISGIANSLLVNAFNHHKDAKFLVCGGDLTERPIDSYWKETAATLDSLGQAMPVLTVTGNHDYLKDVICKLERRFSLVHSYFLDSMQGENQVFTMKYGDTQFFLLDSNREVFYLAAQRQWLDEQLNASNAKWKIVIVHHPLYSIKGKSNNLIQKWMFDDLIHKYDVDLVLQGHEHAYARMTNHNSDSNEGHADATTPVYTVSHCSPKNYRIEFDDTFDKFGSGSRYYQKVCTHGDSLIITAYNAHTNEVYDSLLIVNYQGIKSVADYGKTIAEKVFFEPDEGSKKDKEFAERINEYKKNHPERFR